MVNLFENIKDTEYISTYEPIDWSALERFAANARLDIKENTDAIKEAAKGIKDLYVSDPSSKMNDDMNKKINSMSNSITNAIKSPDALRNLSPGAGAGWLAEVNSLAGQTAQEQQYAAVHWKKAEDAYRFGNNSVGDIADYKYSIYGAGYDLFTNADRKNLIDSFKAVTNIDGNKRASTLAGTKAVTHNMILGWTDDPNLQKIANEDEMQIQLAIQNGDSKTIGEYGRFYEKDANGNFLTDMNGGLIRRKDASVFGDDVPTSQNIMPNGVVNEKDENGNPKGLPNAVGENSIYTYIKYKTIEKLAKEEQEKKQPTKRGSGSGGSDDDRPEITFVHRIASEHLGGNSSHIEMGADGYAELSPDAADDLIGRLGLEADHNKYLSEHLSQYTKPDGTYDGDSSMSGYANAAYNYEKNPNKANTEVLNGYAEAFTGNIKFLTDKQMDVANRSIKSTIGLNAELDINKSTTSEAESFGGESSRESVSRKASSVTLTNYKVTSDKFLELQGDSGDRFVDCVIPSEAVKNGTIFGKATGNGKVTVVDNNGLMKNYSIDSNGKHERPTRTFAVATKAEADGVFATYCPTSDNGGRTRISLFIRVKMTVYDKSGKNTTTKYYAMPVMGADYNRLNATDITNKRIKRSNDTSIEGKYE